VILLAPYDAHEKDRGELAVFLVLEVKFGIVEKSKYGCHMIRYWLDDTGETIGPRDQHAVELELSLVAWQSRGSTRPIGHGPSAMRSGMR
jgi:hypothetical protein